ncbi:MAG TPA: hypothetical protein VEY89_08715, partial [Candidatus Dormibacteraeota bacterium]|nr:hypothetical protein [Candidatus Dormibacteraeota bacterium]
APLAFTLWASSLVAVSSASAASPPINDNYLASLNLNQPGSPLNRVNTLTDVRDLTAATVQSDIFSPQQAGGPAEVTGCNGVSEGNTIWYDFYPDANGLIRVRTSAQFGTVMAVMPYDTKSLLPNIGQRKCAVNQISQTQELYDEVKAGGSYTVQIGSIGGAGGPVETLFDYLVKLKRLQVESTLTAQPLLNGIRVVNLLVNAPKKTHVLVRCSSGCGAQAQTARTLSFSKLHGVVLKSGSALKIYVTAKNAIGEYIEYKIRRGTFLKSTECLQPGSKKPSQCE